MYVIVVLLLILLMHSYMCSSGTLPYSILLSDLSVGEHTFVIRLFDNDGFGSEQTFTFTRAPG